MVVVNGTEIIAGILIGGIFGLIAQGVSLQWGVMKAVNWAYGALLMLFMYITYFLFVDYGISPFLSILISIPIAIAIGFVIQKFVVSRTIYDESRQLWATLSIGIVIAGLLMFFFGENTLGIHLSFTDSSFNVWGTLIQIPLLIVGVVGAVSCVILHLFVTRTWYGKAIRATAQNRAMASVVGVNTTNVYMYVSMLSLAIAAMSGAFLLLVYAVNPDVGPFYITLAFVVTVIGRPGNVLGSLLGGIVIGLTGTFVAIYIGEWATSLAPFIILIALLLIIPTGRGGNLR
jgi:branched-chain amino acid transport system permease protein